MGHSHSSLRKSRRLTVPVADTADTLAIHCGLDGKDSKYQKDYKDNDGRDHRDGQDNKDDKSESTLTPQPKIDGPRPSPVPAPIPRSEDYLSPTSHDDEGVPLGRLRALCPSGPVPEPPVHDVIASVLAKQGKARGKAETAGMARARRSKNIPRRRRHRTNINSIDSIDIRDKSPDLDVLAARALYNAACSPLCRLPDDVLARIMCHLGWDNIYFLRHTCRLFMRVFSTHSFFRLIRAPEAINNNSSLFVLPTPWSPEKLPESCSASEMPVRCRDTTVHLRDRGYWRQRCRDALRAQQCAGCRAAPQGYQLADVYMHCTACRVDHPTDLFSGPQTRMDAATAAQRVCIGHEGHVRLCDHKTVDWATVVGSLPGRRVNNNFRNQFDTDAIRLLQMSSAEGATSTQAIFSVEPYLRIVCDHPSHGAYSHHGRPNMQATPDTQLPPYRRFAADHGRDDEAAAERPSFVVHDMIVDGVNHKVVTWSYTAHMDLADNTGGNGAITAQTFRNCLHDLRKTHSPARYIAPLDYPGLLHELRCVDPERCGCLLYPGFQRIQGQGTANTPRQTTTMTCRQHEVVRVLNSRASNMDHIRIRLVSCDRAPRCLKLVYTRTIRLEGFCVNPDPLWPPAIVGGGPMNPSSIFNYLRDALYDASVPLGWYQALDPLSYRVNDGDQRVMSLAPPVSSSPDLPPAA
ncbi:hypothetical protein HMPREF1624_08251 [Sporothrix schenckii ATCC 58251]|uniref:F-box domain-containing protein n=1 Tax=Sporothrix schenckii (strain ATCC 58251 / de Perez 2211183) TaxID=1391915 RepID=U7PIG7_SPOS1|nr:hypothetical protein HMPREF1624_08251 [Sporothrix schenckii ATCC 58251]